MHELKYHNFFLLDTLYNSSVSLAEGLRNFTIRVGLTEDIDAASLCYSQVPQVTSGTTEIFACPRPIYGSYVSVTLGTEEALTLCEVQVWGQREWTIMMVVLRIISNMVKRCLYLSSFISSVHGIKSSTHS